MAFANSLCFTKALRPLQKPIVVDVITRKAFTKEWREGMELHEGLTEAPAAASSMPHTYNYTHILVIFLQIFGCFTRGAFVKALYTTQRPFARGVFIRMGFHESLLLGELY